MGSAERDHVSYRGQPAVSGVVFVPQRLAHDEAALAVRDEVHRNARVVAGDLVESLAQAAGACAQIDLRVLRRVRLPPSSAAVGEVVDVAGQVAES